MPALTGHCEGHCKGLGEEGTACLKIIGLSDGWRAKGNDVVATHQGA